MNNYHLYHDRVENGVPTSNVKWGVRRSCRASLKTPCLFVVGETVKNTVSTGIGQRLLSFSAAVFYLSVSCRRGCRCCRQGRR